MHRLLNKQIAYLAALTLFVLATGCSKQTLQTTESRDGPPLTTQNIAAINDAIPKHEPKARYGNHSPYKVFGKTYHVMPTSQGYIEEGTASWYGQKFAGRFTSSREIYDPWLMTAAHKSLPLPSYVRVTNLINKRSVIVKVNDRGPFHGDRIIDLSFAAAKKLGFAKRGTAPVKVEAIEISRPQQPTTSVPLHKKLPAKTIPAIKPRLFLQAGAFKNPASAHRLKQQLNVLLTAPIQLGTRSSSGQKLYRVFVGPFKNQRAALAAKTIILEAQLAKPLLVMR